MAVLLHCLARIARAHPVRPIDGPLDVVARAVAPDERPAELDRSVVDGRGDALDQEGGSSGRLVQQARLTGAQQDGLEGLASPHDAGRVALCEQFIQRFAFEVR